MGSIYDNEVITLQCSKCALSVTKRVIELRTKAQISCTDCGADIPIGNLTERVADAISRRLSGPQADTTDNSYG